MYFWLDKFRSEQKQGSILENHGKILSCFGIAGGMAKIEWFRVLP